MNEKQGISSRRAHYKAPRFGRGLLDLLEECRGAGELPDAATLSRRRFFDATPSLSYFWELYRMGVHTQQIVDDDGVRVRILILVLDRRTNSDVLVSDYAFEILIPNDSDDVIQGRKLQKEEYDAC